MKAHHGGLDFAQHVGGFGAKRRASRPSDNAAYINAELLVIRGKRRSPSCFALGIGRGRRVAKEIHIERLAGLCFDRRQLLAHGVNSEHRAWE